MMLDRTIGLLCYPRSGSNWLSYCMEVLGGIKTEGLTPDYTCPLSLRDHPSKYVIRKTHGHRSREMEDLDRCYKVVCLVRDYRECIISHIKRGGSKVSKELVVEQLQGAVREERTDYIQNIQKYDSLRVSKLIIYYEDLVANCYKELSKISQFLSINLEGVDNFLKKYDHHVKKSIENYRVLGESFSRGDPDNISIHSQALTAKDLKDIDRHLWSRFPQLCDMYLLRYKIK